MTTPIPQEMDDAIRGHDVADFCDMIWRKSLGDLASPTVAGGPDGPEPAPQSQPKALIDYRKEADK